MNTYNHHRILNEVEKKLYSEGLKDKNLISVFKEFAQNIKLLEDASDFTDDFCNDSECNGLWDLPFKAELDPRPFYYYHFYYDIQLLYKEQSTKGTILLVRSKRDDNRMEQTFENCTNKEQFIYEIPNFHIPLSPRLILNDITNVNQSKVNLMSKEQLINYKAFFSSVNGRDVFLKKDILDMSNQSDVVAFLHAMGAENNCIGESFDLAKSFFKEHLKKCFSEYLFLRDYKEALFILGIALHGIMDSFTPSHMDFQHYAAQDGALHAQGDVIPFRGDAVYFEPGQYTEDGKASKGKSKLAAKFKHYNGDDHISDIEFEMFKIFTVIGAINNNKKIQEILDGADLSRMTEKYNSKRDRMENVVEPRSLQRLKDIIKENNIEYGEDAFIYSDAAITVCKDVFVTLSKAKLGIGSYEDYKRKKNEKEKVIEIESKKEKVTVIEESINIWETKYKELAQKRDELFNKIRDIRKFSDKEKEEKKNPFAE